MVDAANAYFRNQSSISSQVVAYGGNDIELGWSGPSATRRWVGGYGAAASYPYYVDGDAAGCPPAPGGDCQGDWNYAHMYYVNWEHRLAYPVPQIYREDGMSADQWQLLSAYGYDQGSRIRFVGAMTQYFACIDNVGDTCGENTSRTDDDLKNHPNDGWRQLYNKINDSHKTRGNVRYSTDVRWELREAN